MSQQLFANCKTNPNHHYALHVKAQLSWWGPLRGISENSGERLNGFLQRMKNNGQADKFGLTIMKSFCQWQRLFTTMPLHPNKSKCEESELDFQLNWSLYIQLLDCLKKTSPEMCDYSNLPHPKGANIFLNYAKELRSIECGKGPSIFKVLNKPPNNIIKYKATHGNVLHGAVAHILKVCSTDNTYVFLVVKTMKKIHHASNTLDVILKRLSIVHCERGLVNDLVKAENVSGICAYRNLPAWSLDQKDPTIMVHVLKDCESGPTSELTSV
ncbi:hypothetical protein O181_093826 [Austropuccinia psidii MF-1]|uniref:Uncharacterized protein n=1 Tax=Austropuccinia psidii MF-1 TaxID=1389203 RepID=A0A9Q3J220_9BASI|nr:hypothetical protein [Austropuccinia psidii MF-1]